MNPCCGTCLLFHEYPQGQLNGQDGTCCWRPETEPEPFWLKFEASVKKTHGQACEAYKQRWWAKPVLEMTEEEFAGAFPHVNAGRLRMGITWETYRRDYMLATGQGIVSRTSNDTGVI